MSNRNRSRTLRGLALLALALVLLLPVRSSLAQDSTATDLINAVNALRASRGLPPYKVDPRLMSFAQQHSEYQASIGTSTHSHSDLTTAWMIGIQENIAAGESLTPDFAVNTIWTDEIHMKTMVGNATGFIGVGVASGGGTIYYTLEVRPGDSPAATTPSSPGTAAPLKTILAASATPSIPIVALVTSTSRPDGAIIHKVGYGQTLWNIALAYGTKIDEIRRLNGLDPNSNNIYEGWKLVIRPASPANATAAALTAAANVSPTATLPTPTPSLTSPSPTSTVEPSATRLPTITPTPTPVPFKAESLLPDRKTGALILILICAAGLGVVVVNSFRK